MSMWVSRERRTGDPRDTSAPRMKHPWETHGLFMGNPWASTTDTIPVSFLILGRISYA